MRNREKILHEKQKGKELADVYKSIKRQNKLDKKAHAGFLTRLGEELCLTEDMLGEAVVTMLGRNQVVVNNYRSITEYTNQKIRLQAKRCEICIEGLALRMDYFLSDEIKIAGKIERISYQEKK